MFYLVTRVASTFAIFFILFDKNVCIFEYVISKDLKDSLLKVHVRQKHNIETHFKALPIYQHTRIVNNFYLCFVKKKNKKLPELQT